jgi:hypothetical protein
MNGFGASYQLIKRPIETNAVRPVYVNTFQMTRQIYTKLGITGAHLNFVESHTHFILLIFTLWGCDSGGSVVKILCYKSEGRWFDPRWCHWIFPLT